MCTVEVRSRSEAEEELAAIGVGTAISHGQNATARVLVDEVLVWEVRTVDRFTTSSIHSSEVAALGHESCDDAMERAALEVQFLAQCSHAFLTCAECTEAFASIGSVSAQLYGEASSILTTNGNVEKDYRVN